jgi:hypothetical protein
VNELSGPAPAVTAATASARNFRIDWYLIAPMLGPIVLLLAENADFMFDPPGWVDTYGLLGRFWHYPEQNPLFEEYKNSRLPWILPGFIVHRLFNTVIASYILHTAVLLVSSVAMYLLLRDALKDRRAAAVTSAAWSCYTWIHGDGGWDYHILAACAYYLMSLWMLVRSALSPPARARAWATGAGAAFACAIHTHLVFVAFLPIAAMSCIVTPTGDIRSRVRAVAVAAGYALVGGVFVTALFGAINAATGGRWLFFLPQIEFALLLSEGNRWAREPRLWLPEAFHLVIPCLIIVAGVVWFMAGSRRRWRDGSIPTRFATVLALQGFLAAGLMAYLQFVARQTILDPTYGAYPLYCHVFIMVGALLWQSESGSKWSAAIAVASPLVIVAPLLWLLPWKLPANAASLMQLLSLPSSLAPLVALAIGGAMLPLMFALKGPARLSAFVVCFGFLNAWIAFSPPAYGIRTSGINRDALVVIRSLDRYTSSLDPSLFGIRFWREREIVPGPYQPIDLSYLFNSFLSTRRRSLVTAAYDRPDISANELTTDDLYTERCVGVLSSTASHRDAVARITHRFDDLGLHLVNVGHHEAASGRISVALTVLALPHDDTAPERNAAPCARPR